MGGYPCCCVEDPAECRICTWAGTPKIGVVPAEIHLDLTSTVIPCFPASPCQGVCDAELGLFVFKYKQQVPMMPANFLPDECMWWGAPLDVTGCDDVDESYAFIHIPLLFGHANQPTATFRIKRAGSGDIMDYFFRLNQSFDTATGRCKHPDEQDEDQLAADFAAWLDGASVSADGGWMIGGGICCLTGSTNFVVP